jgi:hypothetical protein
MDLMSTPRPSSAATQARAARRQRWLRSHACKELIEHLDAGRLSPTTAVRVAHLRRPEQRRELARREGRVRAQELAANTINQFLAQQEGHAIALEVLYDTITDVIALEA